MKNIFVSKIINWFKWMFKIGWSPIKSFTTVDTINNHIFITYYTLYKNKQTNKEKWSIMYSVP